MDILITILAALGVILFIVTCTVNFKTEKNGYFILGCGVGILLSMLIMAIAYSVSIQPIDVYRGKTTLQITYEENIPIDSVVVYKNK